MPLYIAAASIDDSSPLEWIQGRLGFGRTVGSWVPGDFERHVRILHPTHRWARTGEVVASAKVRWREVAAWSGKPLSQSSSFVDIATRHDGRSWLSDTTSAPLEGQLEPPELDRLTEILRRFTSTPGRLWFLVWSGFGGPSTVESRPILRRGTGAGIGRFRQARARMRGAGRAPDLAFELSGSLTRSGRRYELHQGSFEAESGGSERNPLQAPPSFWWPEDRSWFVTTDIDSASTYVGGSEALIRVLLSDDVLEVVPADLEDPFDGTPSRAGSSD